VWRRAESMIDFVRHHPNAGSPLRGEWEGTRHLHFWRDKYRLIWEPRHEDEAVIILAVAPKCGLGGSTVYDRPRPQTPQ